MLDLIMGYGVKSGHCLSKQQNKCSKSKTNFLNSSLIASHQWQNHIHLATTKQIMPSTFI